MRWSIRYLAYPAIMGSVIVALWQFSQADLMSAWLMAGVTLTGVLVVGALERIAPFEKAWLADHGDFVADLQFNALGAALIQTSVHFAYPLSQAHLSLQVWPQEWPLWLDVMLVALIVDFGLYWMHRASHVSPLLWRFHKPHHSPSRLYFLNGERRHIVSAVLLAGPGMTAAVVLGAPQQAFAIWFAILPVHLAFQHANLDYALGPLRRLLGVAEMHRWHHKRDYEDAQVNFGEVFLIWDWIFGTAHDAPARVGVGVGELGLSDPHYPRGFVGQHLAPFAREGRNASASKAPS